MSNAPLIVHLVFGAITLVLYWAAVLTVKGSDPHRVRGRLFFASLVPVGLSVGAMLILRADTFDPARMIQFLYLLLCLVTVGTVGWTSIRWRHLDRFRGLHFRISGLALLLAGVAVLVAGIASRQPLAVILSSIGLVFGGAMVRFAWLRVPLQPKWWLGWHLNAVLLLSSAVHGTLLAVIYRSTIDPAGFDAAQLVTQPGTLLLALGLRFYIGRKRDVPLRFTLREQRANLVDDPDGAPRGQGDKRPRRGGASDRLAVAK
jgi:hypothetical protein